LSLCSILNTSLTSPVRDTSPINTDSFDIGLFLKLDIIDAITAKSPAGSAILIPPEIFIKTSY
jgi:hypothetical protein